MTEKGMENNKVTVIGTIVSGFTFSHAVFGEGFYLVDLLVNRLSEQADIIPLMISERLIDVTKDYQGCTMEASGQFRSHNRHEGTKNRLVLSVFVREVRFMEEFTDYTKTNQIFLDGYICKEPVYRKTPIRKGDRRPFSSSEPPVWQVRLYPMHRLGPQCQIRLRIWRRNKDPHLGPCPEQGVHEKGQRDGVREACGL